MIQRQGIAEPEDYSKLPEKEKKTIPFFPNFALRELLIWLIVINILAILAVFFPWDLGIKAAACQAIAMAIPSQSKAFENWEEH